MTCLIVKSKMDGIPGAQSDGQQVVHKAGRRTLPDIMIILLIIDCEKVSKMTIISCFALRSVLVSPVCACFKILDSCVDNISPKLLSYLQVS